MKRLFSTTVHQSNNTEMADKLYEDSIEILSKIDIDEVKYKNGKTTYFEYTKLEDYSSYKNLMIYILDETKKYLNDLKVIDIPVKITSIWLSEMNKGGSHTLHNHAGSILSGTFYINVPENSGPICFQRHEWMSDPFLQLKFSEYSEVNINMLRYNPKKGDILIWKSDLPHTVLENNSDSRLAVSFNIGI